MTTVGIQALPAVKFPNFYANQETEKEPAPDSNNTSPEEGNSNEDNHSKFNELFKKSIQDFKILWGSQNHPEYETAWQDTLKNFVQSEIPLNEENKIYAIFESHKEEFRFRAERLLALYKKLKIAYDIGLDKRTIDQQVKDIIARQKQLYACYEKMNASTETFKNEPQTNVYLEKIFTRTLKHITQIDFRNELTEKIVSYWNVLKLEFQTESIQLRKTVYGYSFLTESTWPEVNFGEDFLTLIQKFLNRTLAINEVDSKPREEKLYSILSFVNFGPDKETTIFDFLVNFQTISKIKFKISLVYFYCKRLKALHASQEDDTSSLAILQDTLHFLGRAYSSGELEKSDWDHLCSVVTTLSIALQKKKALSDIFTQYEKGEQATWTNMAWSVISFPVKVGQAVASTVSQTWHATQDGHAPWKGKKYLIMMTAMHQWVLFNEKWIGEMIEKDRHNPELKKHVSDIFDFFKKMKFPEQLPKNPPVDQRKKYNAELRQLNKDFLVKLRNALATKEGANALKRYSEDGKNEAGESALVLLELCHQRFVGANLIPFVVELMENLIKIGLEKLFSKDTRYKPYNDRTLYPSYLNLPQDVIHAAIKNVPQKHKTSAFSSVYSKACNVANLWDPHMAGSANYNILQITMRMVDGSNKVSNWLRFSTPTNGSEVNLEFQAFLKREKKQVLLFSLQSSEIEPEASRTAKLFQLNSKRTKVVVFPVKNSDVFNGYADEKEIEAKFTTRVAFEAEVTKKIFPNSPDKLNEPGNYLFPEQWLTDDLFKKLIHECFENTYQIFFDNKEILVKKERIAFIKFFNVILALKLIQKTKADYFAFLCNHSADRTGVFFTILFKILLIAFDKEKTPIDDLPNSPTGEQVAEAFMDGPVIMIAKRGMIDEFHQGLLDALEFLKDSGVRQRIIKHRESILGVLDMKFPFKFKKDVSDENNNNKLASNLKNSNSESDEVQIKNEEE